MKKSTIIEVAVAAILIGSVAFVEMAKAIPI